ncbi:DUF2149 domain-containing protein [Cupriavidus basilensis]|uniref:DUF2149 domain-containing protein n=1 Tax=Cupriavidus basilensis TaxID=68895 RepID=A0ABT6AGC9_9BURK|nr:DUF2149 domain-containing protein [Cupriavidus basilensis]MDF3831661.1 DUF2149 domain-containing protein [Cupriavidus basilensis]
MDTGHGHQFRRRRFVRRRRAQGELASVHREDPLAGVANLFDASIVFAVGLMVALTQAFSLTQLLNPESQFTMVQRDPRTGELQLLEKNRKEVKVSKLSAQQKAGEGTRLGVAYRLPDGSVVYVPEGAQAGTHPVPAPPVPAAR